MYGDSRESSALVPRAAVFRVTQAFPRCRQAADGAGSAVLDEKCRVAALPLPGLQKRMFNQPRRRASITSGTVQFAKHAAQHLRRL